MEKAGRANILVAFIIFILVLSGCGANNKAKQAETLKKGSELFTKYGCAVCHSLEGKEIYGPALNEIYGKETRVIRNGQEINILVNRDYLIKAISDPRFEKVAAFQNKDMPIPSFQKEDAEILADYIILMNHKNTEK